MINVYFQHGVVSKVVWSIMKGSSGVPENFCGASIQVWLISNDDKIAVESHVTDQGLEIPLSSIHPHLPANVYSLKAVWYKDRSMRKLSVAEVHNAFAVTHCMEEATPFNGDELTIRIKSTAATYGMDGLSAYELACLHGVTTFTSEVEWCKFRGIENILLWLEVDEETGELWAYWADDGSIKDIGMDENTGEVYVIVTDGNPRKRSEDGWHRVVRYDRRVIVDQDLPSEVCPVILEDGCECTVLYENVGDERSYTVSVAPEYKTPENETLSVTVPPAGYAEVSYLKSGGVVFVRGV